MNKVYIEGVASDVAGYVLVRFNVENINVLNFTFTYPWNANSIHIYCSNQLNMQTLSPTDIANKTDYDFYKQKNITYNTYEYKYCYVYFTNTVHGELELTVN